MLVVGVRGSLPLVVVCSFFLKYCCLSKLLPNGNMFITVVAGNFLIVIVVRYPGAPMVLAGCSIDMSRQAVHEIPSHGHMVDGSWW